MSPFHFIRQFQAMFGETPHQFRINARINRARDLLALSDYSVTDVCMEIGLTSLGSFSDLFTRRVGVAPSEYRRQVRSQMSVPRVLPAILVPGCLSLMGPAFAVFEKQKTLRLSDSDRVVRNVGHEQARDAHEDKTQQHHGRQPGQSAEVLYGGLRLPEEQGDSSR